MALPRSGLPLFKDLAPLVVVVVVVVVVVSRSFVVVSTIMPDLAPLSWVSTWVVFVRGTWLGNMTGRDKGEADFENTISTSNKESGCALAHCCAIFLCYLGCEI